MPGQPVGFRSVPDVTGMKDLNCLERTLQGRIMVMKALDQPDLTARIRDGDGLIVDRIFFLASVD
jgi:hypothetical protein